MIWVIFLCVVAILFTSYTNGNKQANDLMVKIGDHYDSIPRWENYKPIIDYILFWVIPTILAIIVLGWWGLLYLPIVWLAVAKLSKLFMVGQLRKRLVSTEGKQKQALKKWKDNGKPKGMLSIELDEAEHKLHQLKWLISHPKMAHHLALSALDDKAQPAVTVAFEEQVNQLDSISKRKRLSDESS